MKRAPRVSCLMCIAALACACEETSRKATTTTSPTPATPSPTPATTVATGAPKRYGDLMAEVGRRFERAGHAVVAGRWELAGYDVGEIGEIFEDDIPIAVIPEDVKVDLRSIAQAFANTHPAELTKAIAARDRAAFDTAFARASVTCNACHSSAGKPFIEVPSDVGASVPKLTTIRPSAPLRSTTPDRTERP